MFDPYNMKTRLSILPKAIFFQLTDRKIIFNRNSILVATLLLFMQGYSQTDKRLVLADEYFAKGDYYTAASLYNQFLSPSAKQNHRSEFPLNTRRNKEQWIGRYQNKTDILFKLAESYRLANYWMEATALYKQCFEKDSARYASSLYWLAVCQRSIGEYENAEQNLHRFLSRCSGKDEYYNAAVKEKQTLQFIKNQLSKPDTAQYQVRKIKTTFGDKGIFAPVVGHQNQYIFTSTSSHSAGDNLNPHHNRLFHSTLTTDGLPTLEEVNIEAIDSSLNQGAASISSNGKHLYFTQWSKENNQIVSSIYISNKTDNGWSKPQRLHSINQQGRNSKHPFCTADGRYLFFASDRTGGAGGFDIWYAPLQTDGTTGQAVNAGRDVNSSLNEQAPFYHKGSETLVFASDRLPTMGGYDLFTSKGIIAAWKAPENMGYPFNSSRDDVYFFAAENENLLTNAIVSSDRGSECCLSTYTVTKYSKKKMITGVVLDCTNNQPLPNANVVLKDASGKILKASTAPDGTYIFDINDNASRHQVTVNFEKYNDKTIDVAITGKSETNWQADTLRNAAICIDRKFILKLENVVTVYFDFDKSDLKTRSASQLDSIYKVMIENPTYTLQISGYTDGKGSVEYNRKLSDRRAKSCADYLIKSGIDPARISFESFGACCLVEMELINGRDNEEGRGKNRRALINITKPN